MLSKSKVKYIQSLGQKKFRQEEGVFIAEGPKLVLELLLSVPGNIVEVFAVKEWMVEHQKQLVSFTCTEIPEQELEKISQLATPNMVLALVKNIEPVIPKEVKGQVVLALDGIQDPGNLGTIIRIADWFGITQIMCSEDSADVFNPKVVQSTMGSIARVRVSYTSLVEWLSGLDDVTIYATVLEGQDVTNMKKISSGVLLIGNESKGISPEILKLANATVTIPRKGGAESLNAAVATGIVLSHLI